MTTEKEDLPSEEQEEKSVAQLEQEARERRQADLAEPEEEETAATSQRPEVTALNKRKRGKTAFAGLVLAIFLIFLAWAGTWFYKTYLREPPQEKQTETTDNARTLNSQVRKDLGKDAKPWGEEEAEKANEAESKGAASSGKKEAVSEAYTPPRLNKALALVSQASAAGNSAGNAPVMTRKQEAETLTGNGTTASDSAEIGQLTPKEAATPTPSPVRRIPYDPDLYVPELTNVECSMNYRFVSDVAGKFTCTVSKDVYSASGRVKLIEKDTTAYIDYRAGTLKHGQGRLFLMVEKLRTHHKPYLDIPLINSAAAGELGESGVSGWIDQHWLDRFGGALMVGVIPDGMAAISNNAGKKDRNTDYTENSRQSLADMAKTTLDNSINIPPTLYKNQGEIINLIVGQDIDFSKVYALRMKNK
ncbi:VirB10/TraB/TrbI family type IV secretion system protein [Candidatus Pantoea soli]|uniref:TrbI/VirB10 family protein n=1 Tax=Candidatus Pantoea soli TaxID=3098669 RepID=A0A518XJX0_9GAMM|nr:VirB10/TraB/TrbI family type IV secretion system protein [Pantoea soli]QDY44475.1 TrbI/VirB10 family protein [Pantoea soli]